MCTQLANDHVTAIDKLGKPETLKFTEQLFTTALQADSVALLSMMAAGAKQNQSAQMMGQQLGRDAMVQLSKNCPAALPLILKLGQTDQAKQAAMASLPAASAAEKKVLQPLANNLCARLSAADAKAPLLKRTAAERENLLVTAIQQEIKASRPGLLRYYSAAQLADKPALEEIIKKVCGLMVAQDTCASYLTLMGVDKAGE